MSGHGSSCGACKFLRRKCTSACVFAPFFSYEQSAAQFAAVHKIFGASNASKLLSHLPMQSRGEAAITICYEAQARVRDPIYGCVAHIFALQQQVASLQEEIEKLAAQVLPPAVNGASNRYGRNLGNMGTGFHGQLPLQQDAMVLYQALDQKVPESTCTMNFDSDNNIFHGGSNHELLPIDQETLNTWDPSCSTSLSSDFTNKQSYQLEKIGVDIVPQETMWPANSGPCDFLNSNLDHY